MVIADTDALIDFLGGREPAAERVTRELERGTLCNTAYGTALELSWTGCTGALSRAA
jgi:hypothetical protein